MSGDQPSDCTLGILAYIAACTALGLLSIAGLMFLGP